MAQMIFVNLPVTDLAPVDRLLRGHWSAQGAEVLE